MRASPFAQMVLVGIPAVEAGVLSRVEFVTPIVLECLHSRCRRWTKRRDSRVSACVQSDAPMAGTVDRTWYPALKLSPRRYGLCSFLFLRNLLRMAFRKALTSSSGSGADEHRESRALYRAMAMKLLAKRFYQELSVSYPPHGVVLTCQVGGIVACMGRSRVVGPLVEITRNISTSGHSSRGPCLSKQGEYLQAYG
jgi:hypothetical protein